MEFNSSDGSLRTVLWYLEWIIENLEYIQNVENPQIKIHADALDVIEDGIGFHPDYGLCDNILMEYLSEEDTYDLFESWSGLGVSVLYPCGDREDFLAEETVNLYLNPKRISLINHIIEKITEELEVRSNG